MPGPPDFFDNKPIDIPPLFTIVLPESIVQHAGLVDWQTTSSWYFVSSHPLYFDILCRDSTRHRFRIVIKPDLSDASLQVINTCEPFPHDFNKIILQRYKICEDTLVSFWFDFSYSKQYGAYIGLTSSRFAHLISHASPAITVLLSEYVHSACPASGKFVHLDNTSNRIAVHDFF